MRLLGAALVAAVLTPTCIALTLATPPSAVTLSATSFDSSSAGALRELRAAGVPRLAAVLPVDPDADTALVDAIPADEEELVAWIREGDTAQGWVHICTTLKELVTIRKLGAKTIWLNAGAAAAQSDDYVSASVVSDFADSVCADWDGLQPALEQVTEVIAGKAWFQALDVAQGAATPIVDVYAPLADERAFKAATSPAAPPQTKFCMECGVKLPRAARFCSACGQEQAPPVLGRD